jgi:hypothetical protein
LVGKDRIMENQSESAIECLRSYADFCDDLKERREIETTIEFLENLPEESSYEEILDALKVF